MNILNNFMSKVGRVLQNPKLLKSLFYGVEPSSYENCLTASGFVNESVRTFIDIGANKGTFVKVMKVISPKVVVYAFEPVKSALCVLEERFPDVYTFNIALGNKAESKIFNIHKVSEESSFFDYDSLSSNSRIIKTKVSIKRFDSFSIPIVSPCFVKIDTQGYEEEVLIGFGDRLREVDVLQLELVFSGVFSRNPNVPNIMKILFDNGFTGFIQQNLRYWNNKLVQCDLIFFKNKIKGKATI